MAHSSGTPQRKILELSLLPSRYMVSTADSSSSFHFFNFSNSVHPKILNVFFIDHRDRIASSLRLEEKIGPGKPQYS